MIMPNSL